MYEDEVTKYLVNPDGAIHAMPYSLAKARLGVIGWRMATKEEIAKLQKQKGTQRAGKPICKPWSSEPPEEEQELPEPVKKTKTPRKE